MSSKWECIRNLLVSPTQPRYATNTISHIVLYCNRFELLFTQIIHIKQTQKNKENIFNLTVQYLEKYSSTNYIQAFPGGSVVKNPFAMQKMWVWSLGGEDLLEKEMTTHSNILAWRIPWMEEPGRLQFMGSQRVGHYWTTNSLKNIMIISTFFSCFGT